MAHTQQTLQHLEQGSTIKNVIHIAHPVRKLPFIFPTGTAKQVRTQARQIPIVNLRTWLIAVQGPFICDDQGTVLICEAHLDLLGKRIGTL